MIAGGRKKEVVVATYGRDAGRQYLITETDAVSAEKWGWKLAIAVKGTSVQIPEALAPYGMTAVAIRGINSFLAAPDVDFAKLEPLLDELLACVQIVRDPKIADPVHSSVPLATPMLPGDIQEVPTVTWLRSEVIRVHTNFSFIDAVTSWVTAVMTKTPESQGSTSPAM